MERGVCFISRLVGTTFSSMSVLSDITLHLMRNKTEVALTADLTGALYMGV